MYDSHIFCKEYKDLKDQIVDIVNGDTEDYDIDALGLCETFSVKVL